MVSDFLHNNSIERKKKTGPYDIVLVVRLVFEYHENNSDQQTFCAPRAPPDGHTNMSARYVPGRE